MPHLYEPLLIVSDLDGTLLDHHNYNWLSAKGWLGVLQQHAIPLVLCSGKTAAEIIELQKELGLTGRAFIAENGAVIQLDEQWSDLPDYPRRITLPRHDELLSLLNELREQGFKFTTFADLNEKEIIALTGLTARQASLTRLREASENLIWRDNEPQFHLFQQALNERGLALIQGGRFWHVMASGCDKGVALNWLVEHYARREGFTRTTIGLGDSPDDTPLLNAVDYAVIVKGYSRQSVVLSRQESSRIYYTANYGPEGWREGLDHFIPVE